MQRNVSKGRRKGKGNGDDEDLITANDIRFETKPSSFPPPSRTPPRMYSDNATKQMKRMESFGEDSSSFILKFDKRVYGKDPLEMDDVKMRVNIEERRCRKQEPHEEAASMMPERGHHVEKELDELVWDRTACPIGSMSSVKTTLQSTPTRVGAYFSEKEKYEVSSTNMTRELDQKYAKQNNVSITKASLNMWTYLCVCMYIGCNLTSKSLCVNHAGFSFHKHC